MVVFTNPCNPAFTYQIDGPAVKYVGYGDLHLAKYDHLGLSSTLFELESYAVRRSDYTGILVDEEFCPFTVHLYPSKDKEDEYMTSGPVFLSILCATIFLFTSCVFLAYDFLVERRQSKVMNTAEKTNAVVTSLFVSGLWLWRASVLFVAAAMPSSSFRVVGCSQNQSTRDFLKTRNKKRRRKRNSF